MDLSLVGSSHPVSDLKPGAFFAYRTVLQTPRISFGIRLDKSDFLALGVPTSDRIKCAVMPVNFVRELAWTVEAPMIEPDRNTLRAQRPEFRDQPGALLISGAEVLVTAYSESNVDGRVYVSPTSGQSFNKPPSSFVWFAKWSIIVPTVGSEFWRACEMEAEVLRPLGG